LTKGTILVADDDSAIRTVLNQALSRAGYSVRLTSNAATLWRWVAEGEGDLIVTDVVLPDENAFDLLPRIKRARPDLPIIVMSAQNTFMTAIKASQKGAYDYLPKPFEPRELVARIQNVLRRNQAVQATVYHWGELQLDIDAKQLRRNGEVVALTAAEFGLLSLLAQNRDRILSRDEIMHELRGIDADIFSRAIDVLVSRLRSKLQRPELIRTVRGLGYQLVPR